MQKKYERKFPKKKKYLKRFFNELSFELVYTPTIFELHKFPLIRDVKDFPILATVLLDHIDVFVTGDKDFLVLDIKTLPIMTMADFLILY